MKHTVTKSVWMSLVLILGGGSVLAQDRSTTRAFGVAKLIEQLGDENLSQRASRALVDIGPEAVGPLLEVVERAQGRGACHTPSRERALQVIGRMGPKATKAIPRLLRLIERDDDKSDWDVLVTLGEIVPYSQQHDAIRGLINDYVRFAKAEGTLFVGSRYHNAARALSRCAVSVTSSVPTLCKHLSDPNPYVREAAADVLVQRGKEAASATRWLVAAMNSGVPCRRFRLRGTRYVLQGRMSYQDIEKLRVRFAHTVLAVGSSEDALAQAHAWLVLRGQPTERQTSLARLAAMGNRAASAVPILLRGLKDYDKPKSVAELATALGAIGTAATQAIPTLETLALHRDKRIAIPARAALRRIARE